MRAVLVGDHPTEELVPREEDGGGRAAQALTSPAAPIRMTLFEVTPAGIFTVLPSTVIVTAAGFPSRRKIGARAVKTTRDEPVTAGSMSSPWPRFVPFEVTAPGPLGAAVVARTHVLEPS